MDVGATVGGTEALPRLRAAGVALADLTVPDEQAAADVLGVVKAPRRTGTLAATVAAEATGVGFALTAGGPAAPYGPIVHARDPFLTRALAAREQAVVDRYTDHAASIIDDI